MSFTKAKAYLESVGFADHIIEPEASTATVVEAAEAPGRRTWHDCQNHVLSHW